MSLESDLATLLKTNPALASVPIHYDTDPQSAALPKVTLQRVAGHPTVYHNDGPADSSLAWIQLNVIAPTLNQAKTLAKAVKATLAANMTATAGNTRFGGIFVENEKDMPEPLEGGREKPNQLVILSLRIAHYDLTT